MSTSPDQPRRRGVVAVITRHERFLVIRRSQWVEAPRTICFPGGGIEDAESEEAALAREIREELSVDVAAQQRIWESITPWNIHLAWWSARLPDDAPLVPNPAEVESVHWWTIPKMLDAADLLQSNRAFLAALSAGQIPWKP